MIETSLYESDAIGITLKDRLAILRIKDASFSRLASLESKGEFFSFLAQIEHNEKVAALLILPDDGALAWDAVWGNSELQQMRATDWPSLSGSQKDKLQLRVNRVLNAVCQSVSKLSNFKKLVIAGLRGQVVSPYVGLSLIADLRLVSQDMYFDLKRTRDFLLPCGALAYYLPRFVGRGRASELLLTADGIRADDALAMGLVSEVISDADFTKACISRARELAQITPDFVATARSELLADSVRLEKYLDREMSAQYRGMTRGLNGAVH